LYLTGKLLDRDYRVVERQYCAARGVAAADPERNLNRKQLEKKGLRADFPLSRARLRSAWYLTTVFLLAVAGYGFSISFPLSPPPSPNPSPSPPTILPHPHPKHAMTLPLLLQFLLAFTATGIFTANTTLMADLYPGRSASATAVINLVRCTFGAAGVAVVLFVIDGIGAACTFVGFEGLTAGVVVPLLWMEWRFGEGWRRRRGPEREERGERGERESC
jgi:MFS family permease